MNRASAGEARSSGKGRSSNREWYRLVYSDTLTKRPGDEDEREVVMVMEAKVHRLVASGDDDGGMDAPRAGWTGVGNWWSATLESLRATLHMVRRTCALISSTVLPYPA